MSNTNQKYIRKASITKRKAFQSMYDVIRTTVLNGNKYLSDKMFSKLFNRNETEGLRLFKDINKQLIKDLADGLIDFERFKSLFKKVKNIL